MGFTIPGKTELRPPQEDALRAAIRKLYPHKEPEFDLALHLGCRPGNMYGQHNAKRKVIEPLQWTATNLDFRVVHFISKNGEEYRVPINDAAGCVQETSRAQRWHRTCNSQASSREDWRGRLGVALGAKVV
jgi:hypothetical protein